MRIQEQRRSGDSKRYGKEEERRTDKERWKKESVLLVGDLGTWPIVVETWKKRDQHRCL